MASQDGTLQPSRKRPFPFESPGKHNKRIILNGSEFYLIPVVPPPRKSKVVVLQGIDFSKIRFIFNLPTELFDQIFDLVWPSPMFWAYGEEESHMNCSDLQPLHVSRNFREKALPVFGKMTTLSARAENLRFLKTAMQPDLLAAFQQLQLTTTGPATGSNLNPNRLFLEKTDKWAGPGILTPYTQSLKIYCLRVDLGYVRLRSLDIGTLIYLRREQNIGPSDHEIRITFRHHNDTPNIVRGRNGGARHTADYRFQRRWTFVFIANSQYIEIERELHMEKFDRVSGTYVAPPPTGSISSLLCGYCFRNAAMVAVSTTRKVCADCGLAAYCSNYCRGADRLRHKANECVFGPWWQDAGFAGLNFGDQGHVCRKSTTTWDQKTRVVESVGVGVGAGARSCITES